MSMADMLKRMLPIEGEFPRTKFRVTLKKGWLIIAIKIEDDESD